MAAIAGPMRSAENRSKCSRDFQKSITSQARGGSTGAWALRFRFIYVAYVAHGPRARVRLAVPGIAGALYWA